jgi:hypothetical protein
MSKFNYTVELSLALAKAKENCKLDDYKIEICEAVKQYNEISKNSKNKKQVIQYKVTEDLIILELESESSLLVPAKALVMFTRYLIKLCPDLKHYIVGNRLFKGNSYQQIVPEIKTASDLGDVEAMQLLINIFFNKSSLTSSEMRINKKAIADIKVILVKKLSTIPAGTTGIDVAEKQEDSLDDDKIMADIEETMLPNCNQDEIDDYVESLI